MINFKKENRSTMVKRKRPRAFFSTRTLLIAASVLHLADANLNGEGTHITQQTRNDKSFSPVKSTSTPTSQHTSSPLGENVSNIANLVEVYEHEFYDSERKAWIGGSGPNMTQRWTSSPTNFDANTKILPPPPQLVAPKGYDYTSEWKIDVTGSTSIRDELGWEYFIGKHSNNNHTNAWASGRRRRRWLRSVALNTYIEEISTIDLNTRNNAIHVHVHPSMAAIAYFKRLASSIREIQIRNYIHQKIFKELKDSFNFKGYGLAFYKSMLNRQGCGVVLRLPLTVHFDFFETRPWLPMLTTTGAFYFPFRGAFSLNASLPVAFLRFIVLALLDQIKFGITLMWYLITKTIMVDIIGIFILSNIGKMLGFGTKGKNDSESIQYDKKGNVIEKKNSFLSKLKIFQDYPVAPLKRDVRYSSRTSERLGLSVTWQVTEEQGIEFKWSWWLCVLPTIEYIGEMSQQLVSPFVQKKLHTPSNGQLITVNEWLRRKVGSFGFVWGGFKPEPPFYSSCSAALSLSGFYYGEESLRKLSSVPGKIFSSSNKSRPKSSTRIKRTDKKREKNLQDIMTDSEDSECEIIDVKVSAS